MHRPLEQPDSLLKIIDFHFECCDFVTSGRCGQTARITRLIIKVVVFHLDSYCFVTAERCEERTNKLLKLDTTSKLGRLK